MGSDVSSVTFGGEKTPPSCSSRRPATRWPRSLSGATWRRTCSGGGSPSRRRLASPAQTVPPLTPRLPAGHGGQRRTHRTEQGGRTRAAPPSLHRSHGRKQPVSVYLIRANRAMASNSVVIHLLRAKGPAECCGSLQPLPRSAAQRGVNRPDLSETFSEGAEKLNLSPTVSLT